MDFSAAKGLQAFVGQIKFDLPDRKQQEVSLFIYLHENFEQLPKFPKEHCCIDYYRNSETEVEYNGKIYSDFVTCDNSNIWVSPLDMVGSSWVFVHDFSEKPNMHTLASLLLADPNSLEKIPATNSEMLYENCYYTTDGNHRLYAAFLMERPFKIDISSQATSCRRVNLSEADDLYCE